MFIFGVGLSTAYFVLPQMLTGLIHQRIAGFPQKNALLYPVTRSKFLLSGFATGCTRIMNIDHSLISLCKRGDEKAQYKLYKESFSGLMSVCVRYHKNRDDALASLNQGFFKIITNLESYRPEVPFEAWCKRIMINSLIDEFRKYQRYNQIHQSTDFAEEFDQRDWAGYNEGELSLNAEAILILIQELPPMTRQVFNMYAIDGYTHKEIGERLNISAGTSKWHVSAARKELQPKVVRMLSQEKDFHE